MYVGLSSYNASGVFFLFVVIEFMDGVWYFKGGFIKVCESFNVLVEKKGVKVCFNSEVVEIFIEEVSGLADVKGGLYMG